MMMQYTLGEKEEFCLCLFYIISFSHLLSDECSYLNSNCFKADLLGCLPLDHIVTGLLSIGGGMETLNAVPALKLLYMVCMQFGEWTPQNGA